MKLEKITFYVLLSFLMTGIGLQSQAQHTQQEEIPSFLLEKDQQTFLQFEKQELFEKIQQLNRKQSSVVRPQRTTTNNSTRLQSVVNLEYDGAFYIPTDSTTYNWSGSYHEEDEAVPYILTLAGGFYYPEYIAIHDPYRAGEDLEAPISNFGLFLKVYGKADYMQAYTWDNSSGAYQVTLKISTILDGNGNPSSYTTKVYNSGNWINIDRYKFSFNNANKVTKMIVQQWNGTTWDNYSRYQRTYDSNQNITIDTYDEWDNVSSNWITHEKFQYSYDGSDHLIRVIFQDWNTTSSSLENSKRVSFTYNSGGLRTTEITEAWNSSSSQWENYTKEEYSYNSDDLIKTLQEKEWNGTNWENDEKIKVEYNSAGQTTREVYQLWSGTNWTYYIQLKMQYSNGNLTNVISYAWDTGNSSFKKVEYHVYDYNSNNQCIQADMKKWDGSGWILDNGAPRLIFHYESFLSNDKGLNKDLFTIYPNPAQSQINIEASNNMPINNIRIIDMTGRTVYSTKAILNATSVTLPVNQLNRGVYILEVQSGSKKSSKKIVIK